MVSWCKIPCLSVLYERSRFSLKLGSSFVILTTNPARYFRVYGSLLKEFRSSCSGETLVSEITGKEHRKFTNKNELKGSDSLSKDQKYTKRSSTKERSSKEFSNFIFKEGKFPVKNKTKGNDVKKFRIRDVISDQDLQVKVSLMLKYVEKGRKVLCEVIHANEKNQFEKVLNKLNDSELKDYFVRTEKFHNRSCVTYEQKVSNEKSDKNNKTVEFS